ncbi:molybdopterin-dependent oxidoreductase [Pyruvatibacter sp.]|uniref:molybdopterin-dependent oxidoreductase n=1 Tax=Pyruvatibacter sp. TaxID=1981328 RepID=UPI0032ED6F44
MEQFRTTCSLCEASCGAVMTVDDGKIVKVTADREDALSGGFICAKGAAIPQLEADPDRVRTPLLRKNGELQAATWEEAFAFIDKRLSAIINEHGRQAAGIYVGNALAHNLTMVMYFEELVKALGSTNFFTAGSLDQNPRQVVSGLLFGDEFSLNVPDIDRSQLLWVMGANPAESNGSMIVAPGFIGRMQKLRDRGGRVVVFDPRRTLTAERASEHIAIRPSGDAAFLAAVAHTLLKLGPPHTTALSLLDDIEQIAMWLEPFAPEHVAQACDIDADTIVRLATELRDTSAAAVYGRIGTTTQAFSSLTCWLIDMVNILAGNLDAVGGSMFAKPLLAQPNTIGPGGIGAGFTVGKWTSRVRGAPEIVRQLPMACMAEELETPGDGQVRALITLAGNPIISSPDTQRMEAAIDGLELLVSLDIYQNETSSKADVILPSPPRLAKANYDAFFYRFAVRNYGRYTQQVRPLGDNERSDREVLLRLMAIVQGHGWDADIDALDAAELYASVKQMTQVPNSAIEGRDPDEIMDMLRDLEPMERKMDFGVRIGPFGDGFGARDGITLQTLKDTPQGVDCGPMVPRLPEVLRTQSGRIEAAHAIFGTELARLADWLHKPRARHVLIGRRQLRSNNSWFHNLAGLAHPTRECTIHMNAADARELGVRGGEQVAVSAGRNTITLPVETTDKIAPGVVSIPHGWGHASLKGKMNVAAANPGVNVNTIVDYEELDPLSGNARLNGMPVTLAKA